MDFVKIVLNLLEDEGNIKSMKRLFKKGINALGGTDMDGDNDFDADDAEIIFHQAKMFISVWGHAALSSGEINKEEEEAVAKLLENLVFEDMLTDETIELLGKRKKVIKKELINFFEKPLSLKKIAKYAEEAELEEVFYGHACLICESDDLIEDDERAFLDYFAELLDINKFDKKNIERQSFK